MSENKISNNAKVILFCTILLFVTMSIMFYYMLTHVKELTASPFVYGAQKLSEKYNGADVMCSCQIDKEGRVVNGIQTFDPKFYFNSTSFWVDQHERIETVEQINFSMFNNMRINASE